jgi:fibronectin type 3 domain-containing protein
LLTSSLVPPRSYVDGSVQGGKTYYYVISSVNSKNLESAPSNEAVAIVPTP